MEKVVIATTTMYKNVDEVRFKLAQNTIRKAKEQEYQIVVCDESSDKRIRELFRKEIANVLLGERKGMGAARRQSFSKAAELAGPDGIIVWMEPEKHTFVPLIGKVVSPLLGESADAVIPRRRSLTSYPEIQQHNEWIGNEVFRLLTGRSLDIYFGPQVFRSGLVNFYLDYDGEYGDKWDSIQVPVVRMIAAGKKIAEIIVDYVHPEEQKTETSFDMVERRFEQINNLKEAVKKESIKLGICFSP